MRYSAPSSSFGAHLKSLREAAGFTQEELATIAGLSVHAVSALERGQRRRPQGETVRALATALDLPAADRDALMQSARATPAADAAAAANVASVPYPLTTLVGRERDLRALTDWLGDPAARMITLLGPGGVGKTRLALELARGLVTDGTLRVVFVDLAAVGDPAFVPSAIAEAFGIPDVTADDLPPRVRATCAGRATLLVLDNCEHVLESVPLVAGLLAAAGSLRVLATSRAPLRVRGEREYAVGPLAIEPDASEGEAEAPSALRLLVDRIHDFDPEFRLTGNNTRIAAAICRRLDALPLAIELAAPWLKVLSPEDLLHRLDRDVLSPTIERRDLPPRQQTMNATVAWSYQLLGADEQHGFRRLGVVPGPFPIETAAAVHADRSTPPDRERAQTTVAGLIERSLLQCVESSCSTRPLYRMLETVRAYAAAELAASGEYGAAMEGLIRYALNAATAADKQLVGPAQGVWLDHVRDDLENFRTAMRWLIEHGRAADACDIAFDLLFFWLIRGHAAEGLRWYQRLSAVDSLPSAAQAKALAGAGTMLYSLGELDRAIDASALALIVSGDARTLAAAVAENILGHISLANGDPVGARARFTSAAARFEQLGVAWGVGNSTAGIAGSALAVGDFETADRCLEEAAAVVATTGPWFLQTVLYVRALLAVRRSQPEAAVALIAESLRLIHVLHDRFALVYAMVPLAAAAQLMGDEAWAARILGARDAVTERTGAMAVGRSAWDIQERIERAARTRLGHRRWAREYEAGRRMSFEALLKDVEARCSASRNASASV